MSTSRNNHSKLVETEASRMVPDGFRVKCEQDFDSEDFIVRLTKGRGLWRVRMRLEIYKNRDLDWRGWVRRAISRELTGEKK